MANTRRNRIMRLASLALAGLTILAIAACGEARSEKGEGYALYSEGSYNVPGTYYAEFFDTSRKRYYLIANPRTLEDFKGGSREMPFSKTLIGQGPNRATIVVEQVKDSDLSKTIEARLVNTLKARYVNAAPMTSASATAAK